MDRKITLRLTLAAALFGAALVSPFGPCYADQPPTTVTAVVPEAEDQGVAPLPLIVSPDEKLLHYSGRFDMSDPKIAKCSWPASAITIRFRGSAVNASLGLGANRFTVIMDGLSWPPKRKERSAARSYIQRVVSESNAAGDMKVHFMEFEEQNIEVNGAGAAWHPSVKTNQIMAAKFVAAMHQDLGW